MSQRFSLRPQARPKTSSLSRAESAPSTSSDDTTSEARDATLDGDEKSVDTAEEVHQLEHLPLQNQWMLYFDSESKTASNMTAESYQSRLRLFGEFDNVEDFWKYFNNLPEIGRLRPKATFHLFKSEIKPVWEDKKNHGGFKIQFHEQDPSFDDCWMNMALALVGETLDEHSEVTGGIASRRKGKNRLEIWTSKLTEEAKRKIDANIRKFVIENRRLELTYEVFM